MANDTIYAPHLVGKMSNIGKYDDTEIRTMIENEAAERAGSDDVLQKTKADNVLVSEAKADIATLASRMDEFVTLPEGSTSGDAELADIRVGATGKTYPNAGDAVREQISDLRSDMNGTAWDYSPISVIANSYVNKTTGAFEEYSGWSRTDYIEVDSSETLWIESPVRTTYNACYDANKSFIRAFTLEAENNRVDLPSNTKYIVVSGVNSMFPIKVKSPLAISYYEKTNSIVELTNSFGIFPLDGWMIGLIDATGELVLNWARLSTDYIEISGNKSIKFHFSNDKYLVLVTEYDSNKAFVRQRANYAYSDFLWATLPQTKYVRFSAARRDGSNMTPSESLEFGISAMISAPNKLKVMTYNMGHYNYGTGMGLPSEIYAEKLLNYRRFFGDQNCDVVGIQEYDTKMDEDNTINSNDVLWDYFYPWGVTTGTATALKVKEYPFDGRYSQLTTGRYYCEATMESIYLLSVHLSVGVNNTQTRLDEADEIISTLLADKDRFIMFGDFNPEPGEEDALYKKFTDEGYNIANCGWFGKYYTWSNNRADFDNYEHPSGTKIYYLDNIITSSNIKITNVYPIPSAYGKLSSDHIPLVAELEVEETE